MDSAKPSKPGGVEIIRNGSASVRINPDRTAQRSGWRITFWRGRQRVRRFFADYAAAREEARRIVADLRAGRIETAAADAGDLDELGRGRRALAGLDISIERACVEFAECYRALGGRSVSGFVQTHLSRTGKLEERSVLEAARELIEEKTARGKGAHYLKTLKKDLVYGLAADLKKPLLAVTAEDLNRHLKRWEGRTRNNKINSIRTLFYFCRGKYLPANEPTPADKLDKDVCAAAEVQIWTPEEAKKILEAAKPDEVGFFAIQLFAGIRTEELSKMDWSQVRPHRDPDESHIEVKAADSKMRLGRRIVPIVPALAAYLKKIKKPASGPIAPWRNMRNRMVLLSKRAGIFWKQNACRHSFGSYRLADIRNVFQVSEEMGNSPAMVKKHYFQAVPKAAAGRYWQIRP